MRTSISIAIISVFTLVVFVDQACATKPSGDRLGQLIPLPSSIQRMSGSLSITVRMSIRGVPEATAAVDALNRRLKAAGGFTLECREAASGPVIEFVQESLVGAGNPEAYRLVVTESGIRIAASKSSGFFYAVQTLLQLLPPEIMSDARVADIEWRVPCVVISDAPKYPWRSFMLDSGRQFQTKEFIKRYLDHLAALKMNVFHWHLTEGQGWRLEIKRFPALTEIGSRVADGEEQQGFYTQEDVREIVEYARHRCISVVPEIDVPGHSEAALIAHPEFTCFGEKPASVMGYSHHLFCAGKERTYEFLEQVLDEVCGLFPGPYVHLGGDEAPKANWDSCASCQAKIKAEGLKNADELQVYFSKRLSEYLRGKGKKVILWGDVVEQPGPKLPENVIVHWWNYRKKKDEAFRVAQRNGSPVVCGTNYYTYLNYPVTPWSQYKEDRTFDLRMTYESNPSDLRTPSTNVMGMSACLWTDWHVTMRMVDQRVFPRLLALAEQMWSTAPRRVFTEFHDAVRAYQTRLAIQRVKSGPGLKEEIPPGFSWD